ncbi:MAG: hypothetical protein HQM08_11770 [Candidatus Riflebacteria bacterium]|nr:hypothetical protein [Candidatus Riflebacteria bacterium]
MNMPFVIFFIFCFLVFFGLGNDVCYADLTFQGPSGYVQVPSAQTIKKGEIELGFHSRTFTSQNSSSDNYYTNMAVGFSPLRDFEVGVQKAIDSRRGNNVLDPDPTVNLKFRLPPMGKDFSETALGLVLDCNPNNYHTMYFTVGGVGIGWNFGGNQGSGVANFGSYDRGSKKPKDLFLMVGADLYPSKPGERGYRSHYLFDYNGDVFSVAWRYKSHRGFWVDLGVQGKGSYSDFYDYQPVFAGFGAIF